MEEKVSMSTNSMSSKVIGTPRRCFRRGSERCASIVCPANIARPRSLPRVRVRVQFRARIRIRIRVRVGVKVRFGFGLGLGLGRFDLELG
jgi:hypothetical protein